MNKVEINQTWSSEKFFENNKIKSQETQVTSYEERIRVYFESETCPTDNDFRMVETKLSKESVQRKKEIRFKVSYYQQKNQEIQ